MRPIAIAIATIFLTSCSSNGFLATNNPSYRYVVSKGSLYAITSNGYYGSERGVLRTESLDDKWNSFAVPEKTVDLCENADQLYALTSKAQLWKRSVAGSEWTLIWTGGAKHQWTYDVECEPAGNVVVTTSDAILLLTSDGKSIHEFRSTDKSMFVRSFLATDRHLVIECNPYTVAVFDTQDRKLEGWNDGFGTTIDPATKGPCHVKPHGDRFLASRADGIYVSNGILQPWTMLTDEFALRGMNSNFCRDLTSLDPAQDTWLVATNSGIQSMRGAKRQKTVFEDTHNDHRLIQQIVPFQDDFLISFARLNNSIGVRLAKDVSRWETLRP